MKINTLNTFREAEIAELRALLDKEKAEAAARLEKEKEELRQKMEKENQDLREKLAGESSLLKGNIDQNQNQATKRINELAEKLAGMIKGGDMAIKDLTARLYYFTSSPGSKMSLPSPVPFAFRMLKENELLRNLMSQPLSTLMLSGQRQ